MLTATCRTLQVRQALDRPGTPTISCCCHLFVKTSSMERDGTGREIYRKDEGDLTFRLREDGCSKLGPKQWLFTNVQLAPSVLWPPTSACLCHPPSVKAVEGLAPHHHASSTKLAHTLTGGRGNPLESRSLIDVSMSGNIILDAFKLERKSSDAYTTVVGNDQRYGECKLTFDPHLINVRHLLTSTSVLHGGFAAALLVYTALEHTKTALQRSEEQHVISTQVQYLKPVGKSEIELQVHHARVGKANATLRIVLSQKGSPAVAGDVRYVKIFVRFWEID